MKRKFVLIPAFILFCCILHVSLTIAQEETKAPAKADTIVENVHSVY